MSQKFNAQKILAWATLAHENICPLLGVFFESETELPFVYARGENGTLREWRHTSNPSVVDIQGHVSLAIVRRPLLTYFLSCSR
jgi:hypothetical protein